MQDLKISQVQANPLWHKIEENLIYYNSLLNKIGESTDIIAFGEMFTTGFTLASEELAEQMNGRTHEWMKEKAEKFSSAVTGSIIIKENGNYYNRLLWVEPNGDTSYYDKRHLFRMAEEDNFFSAGTKLVDISYKGWKIRPMVCYDLRFPIWARNQVVDDSFSYDILLYVASWPQARISIWDTLLKSRAIENLSYSVGINRVGSDENDINYNGHSSVYGPWGERISFSENQEEVKMVNLSYLELQTARSKFPAYQDADSFSIDN